MQNTCIKRIRLYGMLFLGMILLALPAWSTMEDDIVGITVPEAWEAMQQVAKEFKGIHKEKPEDGWIETNWIEDSVRRSRGMFHHILYQQYNRRSKLHFSIAEIPGGVHLKVKGLFQDQPINVGGNLPWKTVKMDPSDHQLERENFFKVLSHLQNKRHATPPSNASAPAAPISVKVTSRQT